MWQPCFDKTIIMHKYVGVYIFMLMYNSSSMCYLKNIVENLYIYLFFKYIFCNEMDENFQHMY
jgi:hypothetical protein